MKSDILKKATVLLLSVLTTAATYGNLKSENNYFLPDQLENTTFYIEKFSPIYIHELSEEQILQISGKNKNEKKMSEFVGFLRTYNLIYYRKLNEYIESNIEEMKNSSHFKTMYERDFQETSDTGIVIFIKNDFSVVDIYSNLRSDLTRDQFDKTFNYYVYYKSTGQSYRKVVDIKELMLKIDHYISLDEKGKLNDLSRDQLNRKLESIKVPRKAIKINGSTWLVTLFTIITLSLNFLLSA